MKRKFIKYVLNAVATLFILVGIAEQVKAVGLNDVGGKLEAAVGYDSQVGLQGDLQSTITTVVTGVLAVVGTIFLLLTIYAGILWMTASGAEEKIEKAQGIIKATIIGLVITMGAYAITAFVGGRLSGNPVSNAPISTSTK